MVKFQRNSISKIVKTCCFISDNVFTQLAGVDNLLNLVVELYKQQKTIRAFESSVRSLRDDIMRELNVPKYKKQYASKKVRQQIERTAKNRLHGKKSLFVLIDPPELVIFTKFSFLNLV